MKLICIVRGWWRTLIWSNSFPISGHDGQELQDGSIVCTTCGEIMMESEIENPPKTLGDSEGLGDRNA